MLRPERMVSASIICVRRDVESVLEALSRFGEFHIERAADTTTVEFNQTIQSQEQTLVDINNMSKQLITEKTGFTDIFKVMHPTKVDVTAENWQTLTETTSHKVFELKKEVENLNTALSNLHEKNLQFKHTKNMLTTMQQMGADLAAIEELKLINIVIAAVPHKHVRALHVALAGFPMVFHRCYLAKDTDFVCLAMPSKRRPDIERILKIHHSETFSLPTDLPSDADLALKETEKQLKATEKEEHQLQGSLKKLGGENRQNLVSWREITENILALLRAERKILQSGHLATIQGFVPQKQFPALAQKVQATLNGRALILENKIEVAADPPTLIRHNRFVRPFEEITKLYGVPHYNELDPTAIIAITFPLLFGLMFGDMGHGLLLLVGGLTVGFLIKGNKGIKNICYILAACGVGAIIAGALFGEFFGVQVFAPLWFNPFDSVLSFLIFSLVVGVVQIVSGLVLEAANFLIKGNVVDAVLTSVPKIAFYIGAVSMIAIYQLDFAAWLSGPILLAIVPFVVLVLGKPLWSMTKFSIHAVEPQGEKVSFWQRLFESGDLVTRLLSNTISYSRILALLMAHYALILATYSVAGLIGVSTLGLVLAGVVVVGGNLFVIALEGLIVFIHDLRLHFYEWFSKFYLGTGSEFTPFRQNFIYTNVVLDGKEVKAA
jgi:V/A-type H+/Na+-transporting ATPase subunit I